MAAGRWPLAVGRDPLAVGRWPLRELRDAMTPAGES